jgi:predicted RecB family nuclease
MPAPALIPLSKSKCVAGIQCLKRLYFQVHHPELAEEAAEEEAARLEQGEEVGILAQSRLPGGTSVMAKALDEAIAATAALVSDQSVSTIYEGAFSHSGLVIRTDILQRDASNRWRLVEVKSSVEIKDYYVYDLALQHHVLSATGLQISSADLMYLNRNYTYDGGQYNTRELFLIKDLTRHVRDLEIAKILALQRGVLGKDSAPDVPPGPQCLQPYRCEFFSHCNPNPPDHHISTLPNLTEKKRRVLAGEGIALIDDIPEDFPLTEIQSHVRKAVVTGEPWISETIAPALTELKYPLSFMDFESVCPAIPRFRGMWPYAQLPFQWSIHRKQAIGSELEHEEFVAQDVEDPRRSFVSSLCDALGDSGTIVVYNAAFESQRLYELAHWFPDFLERIVKVQDRLWDLLPFIKKHFYHPGFGGSFSLKSVLPALVPELNYDKMEVSHGGEAGLAWYRMIRGALNSEERQKVKSALLAYCRQDTLAMVRILDVLASYANPGYATNDRHA